MRHKILIVSEAALEYPNADPLSKEDKARVNGVFRTYQQFEPHLKEKYDVDYLTPFSYPGPERGVLSAIFNLNTPFKAPAQNTIRLVIPSPKDLNKRMSQLAPHHIHIATEGPLGIGAMIYAKRHKIPISTAFHTNWQEYVLEDGFNVPFLPRKLAGLALKSLLTIFHKKADAVMAATPELKEILIEWGLKPDKIHLVSRGVNPEIFHPYPAEEKPLKEEYILFVGRLAPGKGVDRFCQLNTPGIKKVVVGTGPLEARVKEKYPDVHFAGFTQGTELAKYYSGAKLFALPSDTETFGMTVIESLACGTPVIALNKGGHQPILNAREGLGIMKSELQDAYDIAIENMDLFLPKQEIAAYVHATKSWKKEAENFSAMLTFAKIYN